MESREGGMTMKYDEEEEEEENNNDREERGLNEDCFRSLLTCN